MSEKLYEVIKIDNLKDMLNKTKEIYSNKIAYQIKIDNGKYKTFTHKQVRNMVDNLGTALIDMGLKNKRIAIIGENRYDYEDCKHVYPISSSRYYVRASKPVDIPYETYYSEKDDHIYITEEIELADLKNKLNDENAVIFKVRG